MTRPLSLNNPHFNSSSLTVLSKILPAFGILCLLFLLPGLDAFIDFHVDGLSSSFEAQFRCHLLRPSLTSSCAILQSLCHYHFIAFIWNYFCVYFFIVSFPLECKLENKDYLFTIDQFLMHSQHSRLLLKVHTEKNLPLHFSCVWPWASNLSLCLRFLLMIITSFTVLKWDTCEFFRKQSAMQMETSNKLVIWRLAF